MSPSWFVCRRSRVVYTNGSHDCTRLGSHEANRWYGDVQTTHVWVDAVLLCRHIYYCHTTWLSWAIAKPCICKDYVIIHIQTRTLFFKRLSSSGRFSLHTHFKFQSLITLFWAVLVSSSPHFLLVRTRTAGPTHIIIIISIFTHLFFLLLRLNQWCSPPLRLQDSDCSTFRIVFSLVVARMAKNMEL